MDARIDDAVGLPQQTLTRVATNFTKFIVGVNNSAGHIGNAHDTVLIQGELLTGQIRQRRLQLTLVLLTLLHQI